MRMSPAIGQRIGVSNLVWCALVRVRLLERRHTRFLVLDMVLRRDGGGSEWREQGRMKGEGRCIMVCVDKDASSAGRRAWTTRQLLQPDKISDGR